MHCRLDKPQRQRKVAQSHWKEELRLVSSHLGEWAGFWSIASEPGFVQEPGCPYPSCPGRDGRMARQNCYPETSIRFQEWWWVRLSGCLLKKEKPTGSFWQFVFPFLHFVWLLTVPKGTDSHWIDWRIYPLYWDLCCLPPYRVELQEAHPACDSTREVSKLTQQQINQHALSLLLVSS